MAELVTYRTTDLVTTITMDDGKVNVFSIPMLHALHEAFDDAERDGTVVLLTGRPAVFSAGFDLKALAGPPDGAVTLLRLGASLAERVLSFPAPVAVACTGHAFPAGAFLLWRRTPGWAPTAPSSSGSTRCGSASPCRGSPSCWRGTASPRTLRPRRGDRRHVRPDRARDAGLLDGSSRPTSWTPPRRRPRGTSPHWSGTRMRPPSSGSAGPSSTARAAIETELG